MVLDQGFAAELEAMFEADFRPFPGDDLRDLEQQPLWHRMASRAAYLLAPGAVGAAKGNHAGCSHGCSGSRVCF
jgi:hypothetical protein